MFFVDLATVGDDSMAPTIFGGDQVAIARRLTPGFGDMTLCEVPDAPGTFVISRVMAVGEQQIETTGAASRASWNAPATVVNFGRKEFRINKQHVDQRDTGKLDIPDAENGTVDTYVKKLEVLAGFTHEIITDPKHDLVIPPEIVEEGNFFLLGDNRTPHNFDSRTFGDVPVANCHGVVFMRIRPANIELDGIPHGWFDRLQ